MIRSTLTSVLSLGISTLLMAIPPEPGDKRKRPADEPSAAVPEAPPILSTLLAPVEQEPKEDENPAGKRPRVTSEPPPSSSLSSSSSSSSFPTPGPVSVTLNKYYRNSLAGTEDHCSGRASLKAIDSGSEFTTRYIALERSGGASETESKLLIRWPRGKMRSDFIELISQAFEGNVSNLDMSGLPIGAENTELFETFIESCPDLGLTLETLALSSVNLGSRLEKFDEAAVLLPKLKHLTITNRGGYYEKERSYLESSEQCSHLSSALAKFKQLASLDLNGIHPSEASADISYLLNLPLTLSRLNDVILDDGFEQAQSPVLINAIERLPDLTFLRLSPASPTPDGMVAIAKALSKKEHFKQLLVNLDVQSAWDSQTIKDVMNEVRGIMHGAGKTVDFDGEKLL